MKVIINILIYTFLILGVVPSIFAQSCINGYRVFRRQSQVDSFPIVYPGCIEVTGSLFLILGGDDPIKNLDSLRQLHVINSLILNSTKELVNLQGLNEVNRIDWMYLFNNEKLESLDGLDSLRVLGGVSIVQNPVLNDIGALSQVEEVESVVTIQGNPQLLNFHGLENLKSIGTNFYVQFNEGLERFEGLESLKSVGGTFTIGNNPKIHHLEGLNQLKVVEKHLFIIANEELEDFSGLEGLGHVGFNNQPGSIFIANNNHLKNIDGLINLRSISGTLGIWNNHQLTSIEGIRNIDVSGITSTFSDYDDFILYNNLELAVCDNNLVCDIVADPDKTTLIFGNKDDCEDREAIQQACSTVENITFPKEKFHLSVIPNPNSGLFTLGDLAERSGEITVYDINGKITYATHLSSVKETPLSINQSGIYWIQFIDDITGEIITQKVIIQ